MTFAGRRRRLMSGVSFIARLFSVWRLRQQLSGPERSLVRDLQVSEAMNICPRVSRIFELTDKVVPVAGPPTHAWAFVGFLIPWENGAAQEFIHRLAKGAVFPLPLCVNVIFDNEEPANRSL